MKIPVTFTFNNKEYKGILSRVSGAGSTSVFHLMVNDYYMGQLLKTDNGWMFYSQSGEGKELGELFGRVVEEGMK